MRVKHHMAETRAPAVLFDVDGTLVDSNYLHVYAWQRAFAEQGLSVDAWRIHRSIGMDGSALVRELSGGTAGDIEQRLKELHGQHYRDAAPLLRPLPGAQLLLRRVAELGLQVVLATSAPEDELAMLRDVLDCDDVVSEVTTSRDVDIAKPQPDIIQVSARPSGRHSGEGRIHRGRGLGRRGMLTCDGAVHRRADRWGRACRATRCRRYRCIRGPP